MITRAAQKISNGQTAQVNTLPALLYSLLLYSILFNSDHAMGWTLYTKRSWENSVSIMTTVQFLVRVRDLHCLLSVPTSSGALPVPYTLGIRGSFHSGTAARLKMRGTITLLSLYTIKVRTEITVSLMAYLNRSLSYLQLSPIQYTYHPQSPPSLLNHFCS